MATWRLLSDVLVGGAGGTYLAAGTIQNDGPGGLLPTGWVSPNADPLDAGALALFAAQGPVLPGRIVSQFSTTVVNPPATYWAKQSNGQYKLTGLGAALAPVWPWRI